MRCERGRKSPRRAASSVRVCPGSIGGIEVGVLADFALHFFPFLFVMEQDHAVAEVFSFDLLLGLAKHGA